MPYFCWKVCLKFGCGCIEFSDTQHVCGPFRHDCTAWMTMKETDKSCEVHRRGQSRALHGGDDSNIFKDGEPSPAPPLVEDGEPSNPGTRGKVGGGDRPPEGWLPAAGGEVVGEQGCWIRCYQEEGGERLERCDAAFGGERSGLQPAESVAQQGTVLKVAGEGIPAKSHWEGSYLARRQEA